MEIIFTILKIIIAAILLICGLAWVNTFKDTIVELNLYGNQDFSPGYKRRMFFWLVLGCVCIIASIYLFCTILFKKYGAQIIISLVIIRIIGILLIIFSMGSFIQSFRKQDSSNILLKEGIVREPNKTARNLRITSLIALIIGIMMITY